jgi:aldehyde:ferredoxin oxidoreductase
MAADGYTGKTLVVDLTRKVHDTREVSPDRKRKFLGGSGLGASILLEEMDWRVDPCDPQSVLVFVTGPLVGLPFSYAGRYVVCGKSPATGGWGEAHASGFWAPELRFAGCDALVIRGRAEDPVYLWIHDGEVEIREARHLWGKDTHETERLIRRDLSDEKVRILSIGGAGEKLSKIAGIMSDGGRAAARGGLGAVMGSKHLKAIAVRGTHRAIQVHDETELNRLIKEFSRIIKDNATAKLLKDYGTSGFYDPVVEFGDVPTKNWQLGSDPATIARLSGRVMAKKHLVGRYACRACAVACGRIVRVAHGPYETPRSMGPEYETIASFGNDCLNDNLESILQANYLANGYGMDTISAGSAIAFSMECYEKGLITIKDTDGIDLRWGNHQAIIQMIHKMGKREGFGDILADGVKGAAEKIGGGSDKFAIHVKGLELPMHDPRAFASWAIAYATSNRGACHNQAITYGIERGVTYPDIGIHESLDRFVSDENKARITKILQDFYSIMESLVVCKFVVYGGLRLTHLSELLRAVTGWDVTIDELMKTGERLYNLNRLINVTCGMSQKDDTIPWRVAREPFTTGGAKGHLPNLSKMLTPYYRMRGWDQNGRPTKEKLGDLSLGETMPHGEPGE